MPENFKSGTADRAQEKAAGPERPLVLAPELRTEPVEKGGSGLAFEGSDGFAQHDGRRSYNGPRDLQQADCSLREAVTKPPSNVLNLPLEQRAEMAPKAAVERVIVEHARQGLPIYIWRDGKVVDIPPDELGAQAAVLEAGSS